MSDPKYMVEQASYRVWNLFELRDGDLPGYYEIASLEVSDDEDVDRLLDVLNETRGTCTWTQDPDGYWHTECGGAFEFMEGGPEENGHKFCPYCGGRLNAHEYEDTWEDDAS